nr:MAG TPA: hypothetical protein [Caudoviricetes sp.]
MNYDLMRAKPKVGQLYFLTDSRVLYKDYGNDPSQRLRFNAVILYSDNDRQFNVRPETGKFYYVEESNSLWLYDTRWILKIGSGSQYNTYTNVGGVISPVINNDESITGTNGDRIIDNNGLLGNGSIVVRDINRMSQGIIESDSLNSYLMFKSFKQNGMLFIPDASLPYNDLSTSLGALHLTIEHYETNDDLNLKGSAYYYGDWNNAGEMYIIKKANVNDIYPDYNPTNDEELVKYYIECSKTSTVSDSTSKNIKTYFSIRPISNHSAYIHIISFYDDNVNSVVKNDLGELIFTNRNELILDETLECTRSTSIEKKKHISKYILDKYDDIIIIEQEETGPMDCIISELWMDKNNAPTLSVNMWKKYRVLTTADLENINK